MWTGSEVTLAVQRFQMLRPLVLVRINSFGDEYNVAIPLRFHLIVMNSVFWNDLTDMLVPRRTAAPIQMAVSRVF